MGAPHPSRPAGTGHTRFWLFLGAAAAFSALFAFQLFWNPEVFIGGRTEVAALTEAVWLFHGHSHLQHVPEFPSAKPPMFSIAWNPNRRNPYVDLANMAWLPRFSHAPGPDGVTETSILLPLWIPTAFLWCAAAWVIRVSVAQRVYRMVGHGRRCVRCAYDMTGLVHGSICPECGLPRARARFRRPWTRPRLIRAAIFWLFAGALATLALAWIPAFALPFPDPFFQTESFPKTPWVRPYQPSFESVDSRRASLWWITVDSTWAFGNGFRTERLEAADIGFPFRCLTQCEGSGASSLYARNTALHGGWRLSNRWIKKDIPHAPIWPALIADALFWAIAGAAFVSALSYSRRFARVWVGRCHHCALDLRELNTPEGAPCPECATPRARPIRAEPPQ